MFYLRYFNFGLVKEMIVVFWDQVGFGKFYLCNFNFREFSMESLVNDVYELIQYFKKWFDKEKIVFLGFFYGSVIGLKFVERYFEDYYVYIGVL